MIQEATAKKKLRKIYEHFTQWNENEIYLLSFGSRWNLQRVFFCTEFNDKFYKDPILILDGFILEIYGNTFHFSPEKPHPRK